MELVDTFDEKAFYNKDRVTELLEKDIKASEASKAIMTEVMTQKDFFSDLDDSHVLGVAGLLALNTTLESKIINEFILKFLIARKSRKGGRSRKDIVEMFKSLREEVESRFKMMREKFGGMFQ